MSIKQKVIIIGPAHPLRGGIANFNEALCKEMTAQGIETKIISFSLQYPDFLFPGKTQYDEGKAPEGIKIETKINSINPFNWFRVANYIKAEEPDYVIIRYWLPIMAPCLGTIAKRLKSAAIPVLAITDNIVPHEKRIGDAMLTAYFIKQCDGFVTMSKSVLNDLQRFTTNNNKIYLPHPIYDIFGEKLDKSIAKSHLKLNRNAPYLLFFGFIRRYKGLDILLEAMGDERIKQLGIQLIVAGEYYEDAAPYQEIIRKHQLENVILRTTYIPSEDVRYYFCAADMIVQPYKTATQSGVTQIAYHFERPMLVTNVGGLPEIVPHQKVGYVTSIDSAAIADAIVDFYQNNREQQFSANTVTEKRRFLWSFFVKGVEQLYLRINNRQTGKKDPDSQK